MKRVVVRMARVGPVCAGAMLLWLVGAGLGAPRSPFRPARSAVVRVGLGPVPRGVLAALNAGGVRFVLTRGTRAQVARRRAIVDAVSEAPWFGYATGASLARTMGRATGSRTGTLVWLVSIQPIERVGPSGQGRSSGSPAADATLASGRFADYFVVAVSARNGRLLDAEDGFSPRLRRPAPRRCEAPQLAGATIMTAVIRGSIAGCALHFGGAAIKNDVIQTVQTQLPAAGATTTGIVLSVNPSCARSALSGPPAGEPIITPGPTRIVTGLFLVGGPLVPFSSPHCTFPAEKPWAGSITITNPGATIAATRTLASGQLATFDLPPGTYTISGTFTNATVNDQPMRATPVMITLTAGSTVRQDIGAEVP